MTQPLPRRDQPTAPTAGAGNAGSAASQGPIGQLNVHLVGVHTIKADPNHQMVAHHYCRQVSPQLTQCAIFDSNAPDAHLIGLEYIIAGDVYRSLPPEEQQYWHPHTYEVSGHLLKAPELPADQEQALLATMRTTYGRTYHEWDPAMSPGHPTGLPDLAWAITGPGQVRPEIQQEFENSVPRR